MTPGTKALVNLTQEEPMAPARADTMLRVVMIWREEGGKKELKGMKGRRGRWRVEKRELVMYM